MWHSETTLNSITSHFRYTLFERFIDCIVFPSSSSFVPYHCHITRQFKNDILFRTFQMCHAVCHGQGLEPTMPSHQHWWWIEDWCELLHRVVATAVLVNERLIVLYRYEYTMFVWILFYTFYHLFWSFWVTDICSIWQIDGHSDRQT